jgi:hypothetical protein
MSDVAKGVLIGIIISAIVAGFGYVILVKENQIKIDNIEKLLGKYDDQMEKSGKTLNALTLFVVSAHPDKNFMPIASARKLEAMDSDAIEVIATSMSKVDNKDAWFASFQAALPLKTIKDAYKLTNEDLENFYNAVEASGKNE